MSTVAVPSKASTIIVARPKERDGFEVLMTRRPSNMQVLAGFLVFPGGGVEEVDWSDRMLLRCRGLSPAEAQQILGTDMTPEQSMAHWVAAVRELFEEAGLHFFVSDSGIAADVAQNGVADRLAEKREALSKGRLDLPGLLESEQLFCDVGRLQIVEDLPQLEEATLLEELFDLCCRKFGLHGLNLFRPWRPLAAAG